MDSISIDLGWIIIVVGFILSIIGVIGCLIPVLPGPPFNYLALLLLHFFTSYKIDSDTLILFLIITVVVTVLDYVVPVAGAKKMGGSNYGLWGCAIGLILGLLFFPPFGLIFGAVIGALVGEFIAGKSGNEAIKAALGSFFGFLLGTVIKIIASLTMCYYFVKIIFF